MKRVDFFVIGVGKGATKALYAYLDAHPQIYMPYHFEVGFFAFNDRYAKGVDWYLKEYFADAQAGSKLGDVSPQYMAAPVSARRIHEHFPDARLIASLRNPIDRAFSAYCMMVRRKAEERSFDEAVSRLEGELRNKQPVIEEGELLDDFEYLRTGFYGCILSEYLKVFPRDRIKLLFTEHLRSELRASLQALYEFIGVDSGYVPANLERSHHEGGIARFPSLNSFLNSMLYRRVSAPIKPFLPRSWRNLSFKLQERNIKGEKEGELSAEQRARLQRLFRADVDRLRGLFDLDVPWKDFG